MDKNTPILKTERLILRKFDEKDMEALFFIFKDKEVNTYLPWFPLTSLEAAKNFFEERYAAAYRRSQAYHYAICFKTDDYPIGYINISMDKSHDLGYGLRKEFWNRGIVTEAGNAVIEQVRRDGMPYITATHDVKNFRSGSVMKRLGMRYQYSYEELWQPKGKLVTFRMYQLNLDAVKERVYMEYWEKFSKHFIEAGV